MIGGIVKQNQSAGHSFIAFRAIVKRCVSRFEKAIKL